MQKDLFDGITVVRTDIANGTRFRWQYPSGFTREVRMQELLLWEILQRLPKAVETAPGVVEKCVPSLETYLFLISSRKPKPMTPQDAERVAEIASGMCKVPVTVKRNSDPVLADSFTLSVPLMPNANQRDIMEIGEMIAHASGVRCHPVGASATWSNAPKVAPPPKQVCWFRVASESGWTMSRPDMAKLVSALTYDLCPSRPVSLVDRSDPKVNDSFLIEVAFPTEKHNYGIDDFVRYARREYGIYCVIATSPPEADFVPITRKQLQQLAGKAHDLCLAIEMGLPADPHTTELSALAAALFHPLSALAQEHDCACVDCGGDRTSHASTCRYMEEIVGEIPTPVADGLAAAKTPWHQPLELIGTIREMEKTIYMLKKSEAEQRMRAQEAENRIAAALV